MSPRVVLFEWCIRDTYRSKSCQCMVLGDTASCTFILTGQCYTHLWWHDMLISTRSFSNGCHFTSRTSSMLLAGIHVLTIETWCLALLWSTRKNPRGFCTNNSTGFCWFFRREFFFPSFPPPSWLWRSVFSVINFCILEGRGGCGTPKAPQLYLQHRTSLHNNLHKITTAYKMGIFLLDRKFYNHVCICMILASLMYTLIILNISIKIVILQT